MLHRYKKVAIRLGAAIAVVVMLVAGLYAFGPGRPGSGGGAAVAAEAAEPAGATPPKPGSEAVDLTEAQAKSIKIDVAGARGFQPQNSAVGSIDFNENRSVQVFPPYAGKILQAYGDVGDAIAKGKVLYTIDSPDLMQAASALIAAAGVQDLTSAALARARGLYESKGIAQKDMEQAVSDQQTAEAALKAARGAVRLFGKTDAEIDAMIANRKIDSILVVTSPVSGRITARNAQAGLLVQPGSAPAPFVVADMSTVWLLADVPESEAPAFQIGQALTVQVQAYSDRRFNGTISALGQSSDPNTHTVVLRSEIPDPHHELRPGMLASFVIRTGKPVSGIGVPENGVVREGDGSMSVWVTTDRHHFTRRTVKIGLQQDGVDQILEGLQPGELVVTDGAIYLSNMLVATPDA